MKYPGFLVIPTIIFDVVYRVVGAYVNLNTVAFDIEVNRINRRGI